jgi:hypothetical protein
VGRTLAASAAKPNIRAVIAPAVTAVFEIADFAILCHPQKLRRVSRGVSVRHSVRELAEFLVRARERKLHFVQVRAHISCYFFGDLVGGAAINSAFRLALSCSTAARTRAIA